jgi:hypothetical protein
VSKLILPEHPGYFIPAFEQIDFGWAKEELDIHALAVDLDCNIFPHNEVEIPEVVEAKLDEAQHEHKLDIGFATNNPADRSHLAEDNGRFFYSCTFMQLFRGEGKPNSLFNVRFLLELNAERARKGLAPLAHSQVLSIDDCWLRGSIGALNVGAHAITVNRVGQDPFYDRFSKLRYREGRALERYGVIRADGNTNTLLTPEQYLIRPVGEQTH